MSNTVKSRGGYLVRVMSAISGFKAKHGQWPVELTLTEGAIAQLATEYLTPLGFLFLQSKLKIKIGWEEKVLAEGANGEQFDYGDELEAYHARLNLGEAALWCGLDWEE